jgi:uncharacterized protein
MDGTENCIARRTGSHRPAFRPLVARCAAGLLAVAISWPAAFAQVQLPKGEPALPPPPAAQSGALGGVPPAPFGGHQPDAPAASLPDLPGVLPWELLGAVKVVPARGRFVPEFPASVARLDKQDVKVQGFMLPLQPGERQSHFLLTVTPQTCAFCVPAGPEGIVEVRTRTPVRVTLEPVVVAGRFEVLKDDPTGVFYRISNAAPVAR